LYDKEERGSMGVAGQTVRWVFLDRDGTLNVKPPAHEYVERPEALHMLPGAAAAVARLNRAGLWVGLVTNQRGVALGRMSVEDLDAVHVRLEELLSDEGANLDAIYVCPHGADECSCRKPKPGLLLQAQRDHPEIDFEHAAIIGDSVSDVQAGRALRLKTILLTDQLASTSEDGERGDADTDYRAVDLQQAVGLLQA
jgi:D-glycero-D-manno-heptose 1,7-bisphosphate phosphatase